MPPTRSQIISYIQSEADRPLRIRDLARELHVKDSSYGAFRRQVRELERDGAVVRLRGNRYAAPASQNLAPGRLTVNPDGFGFVSMDEGPDVFIPGRALADALHGDRVLIRVTTRAGTRAQSEGEVVRVLERSLVSVVGTYRSRDSLVEPDDPRLIRKIRIPSDEVAGAGEGQKVVARITEWIQGQRNPLGQVVEILGDPGDPGVDILSIIREFGLPDRFPTHVQEQAESISGASAIADDLQRRTDLRNICCFTIDPDDARDHDDAVSLQLNDDGTYRLGVHIADVSHFIPEGSPLDHEAMSRGTSVYLVDRVIPMLPERLSADLCSLLPDQDRLCLTVFIRLGPDGEELDSEMCESVIRSRARLTYGQVEAVLKGTAYEDTSADETGASPFRDTLRTMEILRRDLTRRRVDRGALDFDIPEAKVVLDSAGIPIDVQRQERLDSHRLIEEFMLLANRTVAQQMEKMEIPILYRVHDRPDAERLNEFAQKASAFGFRFPKTDRIQPHQIRRFLEELHGTRQGDVLSAFLLRSMKRAVYSPTNLGHFGLAFDSYAHFTSPIRRYPDLLLHRQVRERLQGGVSPQRITQLRERLPHIGDLASHRERVAQQAEWDSIKLKQIEFLEKRIGDVFDGTVVGVRPIGLFVRLDEILIDGLVHVSRMDDDYYVFHEYGDVLTGERTGRSFRMGDAVEVQLVSVDRHLRRIDFIVIGDGSDASAVRSETGRAPGKKTRKKKIGKKGKPFGRKRSQRQRQM